MKINIEEHNAKSWDKEVELKNEWTIGASAEEIANAKKGNPKILLTPTKPLSIEWLEKYKNKKVLCLASGGGQQGPVMAAFGSEVTTVDYSTKQIEGEIATAKRHGVKVKAIRADAQDLSFLKDETFDLILHPVSNCFIQNIQKVWKEAFRVLKKGGELISGFCNPIMFMIDEEKMDSSGKLEIINKIPWSDLKDMNKEKLEEKLKDNETLEFGHSLEQQIDGQIKEGFSITGFFEDDFGEGDPLFTLHNFTDVFIVTRALKNK